jgi:hypothetical protein
MRRSDSDFEFVLRQCVVRRKEVQLDQVRRISIDNLHGTRHIEGVNLDFSLNRGAANMSSFI